MPTVINNARNYSHDTISWILVGNYRRWKYKRLKDPYSKHDLDAIRVKRKTGRFASCWIRWKSLFLKRKLCVSTLLLPFRKKPLSVPLHVPHWHTKCRFWSEFTWSPVNYSRTPKRDGTSFTLGKHCALIVHITSSLHGFLPASTVVAPDHAIITRQSATCEGIYGG